MIKDTRADEAFAPYLAAANAAGFRAVITAQLLTCAKHLIGAVSAHFVNPHVPTTIEIETLDEYSVMAAHHLEHLLRGEALAAKALAMRDHLYALTAPIVRLLEDPVAGLKLSARDGTPTP
jgi:hypothetical protein